MVGWGTSNHEHVWKGQCQNQVPSTSRQSIKTRVSKDPACINY